MCFTNGGPNKGRRFTWQRDADFLKIDAPKVEDKPAIHHSYSIQEIENILKALKSKFGECLFPLANNVEKLRKGTERPGLGTTILEQPNSSVDHAQGASYLGVVLEVCKCLEWNGKHRGIAWKLKSTDFTRGPSKCPCK